MCFSILRFFFEVPFAVFTPAITDRAIGCHEALRQLVKGHGFPFRIVVFPQFSVQIVGAQEAAWHKAAILLIQFHQHREVGVFARVVFEILCLFIQVEFAQDDVTEGHGKCGICALPGVQPDIAKLRGFGIIGADNSRFGTFIARFSIKMRIRCPRLRHIGAPEQQIARVVPVSAFRHVGLLTPCHRRCWGQVAIPVVEGHADAAHQAQVTGPGGIAHHRHCRDRRETKHTIRPIFPGRVDIGCCGDFGRLIPGGAYKPTFAARFDVRGAQDRIGL